MYNYTIIDYYRFIYIIMYILTPVHQQLLQGIMKELIAASQNIPSCHYIKWMSADYINCRCTRYSLLLVYSAYSFHNYEYLKEGRH